MFLVQLRNHHQIFLLQKELCRILNYHCYSNYIKQNTHLYTNIIEYKFHDFNCISYKHYQIYLFVTSKIKLRQIIIVYLCHQINLRNQQKVYFMCVCCDTWSIIHHGNELFSFKEDSPHKYEYFLRILLADNN